MHVLISSYSVLPKTNLFNEVSGAKFFFKILLVFNVEYFFIYFKYLIFPIKITSEGLCIVMSF